MSSRKIKCCFLLYGLPRSLRWTKRSILHNVIRPLSGAVDTSLRIAHFNAPDVIRNPRSLEHDIPAVPPDISGLDLDMFWIERQDDRAIEAKFETFKMHELQAENSLQSHRNVLHAYRSLKCVWTMASMAGGHDSDIFVFLRPDLEYIDPWPAAELIDTILGSKADLISPDWHQYGGLNDRMAIASRKGAEAYVSRWDLIETLVAERVPRNSESLLLRTAELAALQLSTFSSRGLRVRADGRTQREEFAFPPARRLVWKIRHKIGKLRST